MGAPTSPSPGARSVHADITAWYGPGYSKCASDSSLNYPSRDLLVQISFPRVTFSHSSRLWLLDLRQWALHC